MNRICDKIKLDLEQTPPDTKLIYELVEQLVDGLCKFVPSKKHIHEQIKKDILSFDTIPSIIHGLIDWIEKFQAPVHDNITKKWRRDFSRSENYIEFIIVFIQEYFLHVEKMYKEVWDARKRLVNGESVVPPEHRPLFTGKNGIPDKILR